MNATDTYLANAGTQAAGFAQCVQSIRSIRRELTALTNAANELRDDLADARTSETLEGVKGRFGEADDKQKTIIRLASESSERLMSLAHLLADVEAFHAALAEALAAERAKSKA